MAKYKANFGKFYCSEFCGVDGCALYPNKTYPITIDEEQVRITAGHVYLFATVEELKKHGTIEVSE